MLHSNQVFAFGLGLPPSYMQSASQALSAEAEEPKDLNFGAVQHKKVIHCYKASE
jgi:hypothetical protein